MTWKYHIEHVCNKVSKSSGSIYKSRNILSKRLMKQLFFSFTHSYFNYANIAWPSTNKSNLIYLYHHQKHAVRIYDKDRYGINLFQILSLIFKCKNRTTPFVFHNLYTVKPPSKYSLWTGNVLSIPLKRTKSDQFSVYNILAQKTFICNL